MREEVTGSSLRAERSLEESLNAMGGDRKCKIESGTVCYVLIGTVTY